MFHQQLKICHWWFYVDCDSSEQFYNLDPDFTELSIENFARTRDRDRARARADLEEDLPVRYGDNLSAQGYRGRVRARRGRQPLYGEQRARGSNRRHSYPHHSQGRRRIGSRATIVRDSRANRQRRLTRRRTLKAIPSSSFRAEQSRKRIARQVESARKKTDELEIEQQVNNKNERNFEDEIKMLRDEILKALSFLR